MNCMNSNELYLPIEAGAPQKAETSLKETNGLYSFSFGWTKELKWFCEVVYVTLYQK